MANGNEITDANNIGLLNPILYRGYYYDAETGFYYLQSRYYDPEIGRFISVDGYATTGTSGYDGNMFAYCGNNPINKVDPTGEFAISLGMILFATLCVTVVATATIYVSSQSGPIASPGPSIGISIPRRNYPSISLPKNKSKSMDNTKDKAVPKTALPSLPSKKIMLYFQRIL